MEINLRGTVYLLHVHPKPARGGHYIGYTERSPEIRLAEHNSGRGGRYTSALHKRGHKFYLAHTWPGGTFQFERWLKNRAGEFKTKEWCPDCAINSTTIPQLTDMFSENGELVVLGDEWPD